MPLDPAAKLAADRRLLRVVFPDLRRADLREMWTGRDQAERKAQSLRLELPAWIRPAALRRLRRGQRPTPVETQMLSEIHEQRQQAELRNYLADLDERIQAEDCLHAYMESEDDRDFDTLERESLAEERDELEQERAAAARRTPNDRLLATTPRGCATRAPRRTGARSRGRRFRPVRRSSARPGDSGDDGSGEPEPARGWHDVPRGRCAELRVGAAERLGVRPGVQSEPAFSHLRTARELAGLSRDVTCARAGISLRALYDIEVNGARPRARTKGALAGAIGWPVAELFPEDETATDAQEGRADA